MLGISAAADAQVRFLDSSTDAVRKEAIAQDKLVFIDLYATWCGPARRWSATSSRKRRWATLWTNISSRPSTTSTNRPGKPWQATRHTVDPDLPRIQYRGRPAGQDNRIHAGRRVYRRPSEDHRRNREEIATGGCNKERKRFLYEDRFRSPFPSCSEYDLTSDYSVSCPEILLATDVAPLFPATGTVKFPRR